MMWFSWSIICCMMSMFVSVVYVVVCGCGCVVLVGTLVCFCCFVMLAVFVGVVIV